MNNETEQQEVHRVYFWKSTKEGGWFSLRDGRLFDESRKPSEAKEHLCDTTVSASSF